MKTLNNHAAFFLEDWFLSPSDWNFMQSIQIIIGLFYIFEVKLTWSESLFHVSDIYQSFGYKIWQKWTIHYWKPLKKPSDKTFENGPKFRSFFRGPYPVVVKCKHRNTRPDNSMFS